MWGQRHDRYAPAIATSLPEESRPSQSWSPERSLLPPQRSPDGHGCPDDQAVRPRGPYHGENYIQELTPDISIPWLFGDFLQRYTLHHQLLSASYNVGGPSAGYALALNTLSTLLRIPLCIDFGITALPGPKG